jgi:hypothetical protein
MQNNVSHVAPKAGDPQAIDRVWDDHLTAWTGVSRDGDLAVIGRESGLGLHGRGQCQQQEQQQKPSVKETPPEALVEANGLERCWCLGHYGGRVKEVYVHAFPYS